MIRDLGPVADADLLYLLESRPFQQSQPHGHDALPHEGVHKVHFERPHPLANEVERPPHRNNHSLKLNRFSQ